MEIIHIPGYTEDEKMEIAKRHLVKKVMEANGLKKSEFSINNEALRDLISHYTREAGVRGLERAISGLARKVVMEIGKGEQTAVAITKVNLEKYAGVPKFSREMIEKTDQVGYVNGLYWSVTGGGVLPIEAVQYPSKGGGIIMTGQLGEVMKESVTVATGLVRSQAGMLGLKPDIFDTTTIQVHMPAGAIPKDGPSAGLAEVTAMVSALTGIAVRRDVAMTGEVDLRGKPLPIGGLKEKLLGALSAGVTTVLIPEANVKDLAEVPDNVKKRLKIIPVTTFMEVLSHALVRMPTPLAVDDKPRFENGAGQLVECVNTTIKTILSEMDGQLQAAFEKAVKQDSTPADKRDFLATARKTKTNAQGLSSCFKIVSGGGSGMEKYEFAVKNPNSSETDKIITLTQAIREIVKMPANDLMP
jgi:ATP-dependent Lon protease